MTTIFDSAARRDCTLLIARCSSGIGRGNEHFAATAQPVPPSRFALTPALSPGERVGRSWPHLGANDRLDLDMRQGSSPILAYTPERSDAVDARPPHRDAPEVPPLPGGEGWGEGDPGNTFQQQIFFHTHLPRLAPAARRDCTLLIAHCSSGVEPWREQSAATAQLEPPSLFALTTALSPGERVERSWPHLGANDRLGLNARRHFQPEARP